MDRPKHHSIDHLKERGVEKRSGRHSILRSRERSVLDRTIVDSVSRATLGRPLGDGEERIWAFPRCHLGQKLETRQHSKIEGCLEPVAGVGKAQSVVCWARCPE